MGGKMIAAVTVERFEDGLGIRLPDEVVARLGLKEGDTLHMVEREDGILLPFDIDHIEAMEEFEPLRAEFRNAFRDLADK
jgi:antitoxin component of MazEF toxin-antitoxin module